MFSKHVFDVYLEEQQCTRGKNKHTNKQTNPSVLISTVLLSRAVEFCPKLVGPKGKQNDQRLDRNRKRLARAFSREDRAIRPLRVFKLILTYLTKYPFYPFTKEELWMEL